MSVETVFGFLFQSKGASETKRSLADINKEMDELKKRNGQLTKEELKRYEALKKEAKATDQLKESTGDLAKKVMSCAVAYMGFKKILSEIGNFAKGGEDLYLLSKQAGVSAESLERYGIALKNYGGSMSSASATLAHLQNQLTDLRFGGGGALKDAAIRYGISVQGANGLATPEEMLFNIAKRMEGLSETQQLDLGKKLGLDNATITMLQNGVKGLNEELSKASQYTLYNKQDIETSRKYQQSLRDLSNAIDKIYGVLARFLLPIVTAIADGTAKFLNYLADHKGFVLTFLAAVGVALGVIAVKLGAVAIAAIVATAPFWLMILAILAVGAAIGLLVDDFLTFLEGGDSCIGWVAERFADFFEWLFEIGDKVANFFKELWDNIAAWFGDAWDGIVEYLGSLFGKITAVGENIGNFFSGMWTGMKNYALSIWDSVVAKVTGVFQWIKEKWKAIKKWIPFLGDDEVDETVDIGQETLVNTNTPLATMPNQSYGYTTNNSNSSVMIDSVIVNTQATDSAGIASSIRGDLQGEFTSVLYQNTSGEVA